MCNSCDNLSFGQCLDCTNCGFITTDGAKGKCVKGFTHGPSKPHTYPKTSRWYHSDDFWRYMHSKPNGAFPTMALDSQSI
jgi:hypothetical protein